MEPKKKDENSQLVKMPRTSFMKEGGYVSDFDFSGYEIRRRSSSALNG